ncbi:hypothetical protein FJV46_06645 [Arthrobacter agilis]|uniref:hypothetical protein n=1 Tax=Arthrobacter agilis TaxID=37921 RepID=UPI000B350857|nr:hypothetical protein [Arthrobacter agilis]OUM42135.1 hypothetical protein B8W74_08430 [Arthrobacter agilis]PPB45480.1 hypothetical protein CI784_10420 [Arthrobacter agilis]TPV26544.1 hypothetical protein FJV46_06645 [Arthrobacter agilis]VDR33543.1 Uncharacterised protein [Arthrobacter agilis]
MKLEKNAFTRTIAAGAVGCAALWGISGCSNGDDELPAIVDVSQGADAPLEEDSGSVDSFGDYTGVYDREFYDDVEFYVGEEVTVAAIVGEVISPNVFTIVDTAGGGETEEPVDLDEVVIEPLLVVHEQAIPGLAPGVPVGVIGTVREDFDRATIEQELGVDLEDAAVEQEEERAYIEATETAALTSAG